MTKKKTPATRSPARKTVSRSRREFLDFVRTEQTFEEARLMLERVGKQLAHSPMKPWAERLLTQVAAFKKGMRDEEGRLEALAQKAKD